MVRKVVGQEGMGVIGGTQGATTACGAHHMVYKLVGNRSFILQRCIRIMESIGEVGVENGHVVLRQRGMVLGSLRGAFWCLTGRELIHKGVVWCRWSLPSDLALPWTFPGWGGEGI